MAAATMPSSSYVAPSAMPFHVHQEPAAPPARTAENPGRPRGRPRQASGKGMAARRRLLAVARDAVLQAAEAEDEAEQALERATTLAEKQEAAALQAEAETMTREAEYLMRKAEDKMQRNTRHASPSPPTVREPTQESFVPAEAGSTSSRLHSLTGCSPRRTVSGSRAPLQPIGVNVSLSSRDSKQSVNLSLSSACSRTREGINVSSTTSRDMLRAREAKTRPARPVLHPSQENSTQFEVQGRTLSTSADTSRIVQSGKTARVPTPPQPPPPPPSPEVDEAGTTIDHPTALRSWIANVLETTGMNPAELARKAGVASAHHSMQHSQLQTMFEKLRLATPSEVLLQLLDSLGIASDDISLPTLIEKAKETPKAKPAAAAEQWACSLCTKANDADATECSVCKRARGHVACAKPGLKPKRVVRHEAAVKMQCSFRGYATRKVIRAQLEKEQEQNQADKSIDLPTAPAAGAAEDCNWSGSADELMSAAARLEQQVPTTTSAPADEPSLLEDHKEEEEHKEDEDSDSEEEESDSEEEEEEEEDDGGDCGEEDNEEQEEEEMIFFGIASTSRFVSPAKSAQEANDDLNKTIQEAHRSFVEATKEADRHAAEAVNAEQRMADESAAWEEAQHRSVVANEECRRLSMEAREAAVARSKQEAEEARAEMREKKRLAALKAKAEAEAAERRAREIEARRKKMEAEKKSAAEAAAAARQRASEAAEKEKELRQQQEQRVKDLRKAEAAKDKLASDKQQLITQLERKLKSKIAGCYGSSRFMQILKAFDVPCENNDSATVQKAYRKALIKYHPDKAQRKGESWQKVAESEEIYKLVQNEYQKVRASR